MPRVGVLIVLALASVVAAQPIGDVIVVKDNAGFHELADIAAAKGSAVVAGGAFQVIVGPFQPNDHYSVSSVATDRTAHVRIGSVANIASCAATGKDRSFEDDTLRTHGLALRTAGRPTVGGSVPDQPYGGSRTYSETFAISDARASSGFVETSWSDPEWMLATSDSILRSNTCVSPCQSCPSCWYDRVDFPPCKANTRFWKLAPGAGSVTVCPLESIGAGTFDGLFVGPGRSFRLLGADCLSPVQDTIGGPQFVTLNHWISRACDGFEPNTIFLPGEAGGLSVYGIEFVGYEICTNGVDDNGDGLIDTEDHHCHCGNGVLDPGEDCDDGNVLDDDGCAADCEAEVALVYEKAGAIYTARLDGDDVEKLNTQCSNCAEPVLAADATMVVYRCIEGGVNSLRLLDLVHGTDEFLFDGNVVRSFKFAPNGGRIVAAGWLPSVKNPDVMLGTLLEIDVGEGGILRIVKQFRSSTPPTDPSYLPNGEGIIFARRGKLYTIGVDGNRRAALLKPQIGQFEWASMPMMARDLSRVVFRGTDESDVDDRSKGNIFVAQLTSGARRLKVSTVTKLTSDGISTLPSWHPGSSEVMFLRPDGLWLAKPSSETVHVVPGAEWGLIAQLRGDVPACDCTCDCEVPCPAGFGCSEECVCEPADPPVSGSDEPATDCRIECCDGQQFTFSASSEAECHDTSVALDTCAGHCRTSGMIYGGRDFWTGDCPVCCALCTNRSSYHEVLPTVCEDCSGAAETYCSVNDRGGLADAMWGTCGR